MDVKGPAGSDQKESEDGQDCSQIEDVDSHQIIPDYEIITEGVTPEYNMARCRKYPGHRNFIAIKDFFSNSKKHLPHQNQNDETLQALEEYSDRTVRVKVFTVSKNRPDYFLGSDEDKYPDSNVRGGTFDRYGTGFIFPGKVHKDEDCPCKECSTSGVRKKTYQTMYVLTAAHVVYDDVEANGAEFSVFFNAKFESEANKLYGLKLDDGDEYMDDDDVSEQQSNVDTDTDNTSHGHSHAGGSVDDNLARGKNGKSEVGPCYVCGDDGNANRNSGCGSTTGVIGGTTDIHNGDTFSGVAGGVIGGDVAGSPSKDAEIKVGATGDDDHIGSCDASSGVSGIVTGGDFAGRASKDADIKVGDDDHNGSCDTLSGDAGRVAGGDVAGSPSKDADIKVGATGDDDYIGSCDALTGDAGKVIGRGDVAGRASKDAEIKVGATGDAVHIGSGEAGRVKDGVVASSGSRDVDNNMVGAIGGSNDTGSGRSSVAFLALDSKSSDGVRIVGNLNSKVDDELPSTSRDSTTGDNDDNNSDLSVVRMLILFARLRKNARNTSVINDDRDEYNALLVDSNTYIQKVLEISQSVYASNDGDKNNDGSSDSDGIRYSEQLLQSLIRSMDFMDAMSVGDIVRASYVFIIQILELKDHYKLGSNISAGSKDSDLSHDVVFSNRPKTLQAIAATSRAVDVGLKEELALVQHKSDAALRSFKLLDAKTMNTQVEESVRDKIRMSVDKLIEVYSFLVGLEYSLNMLSIGNLEVPLNFVLTTTNLLEKEEVKDEVNNCDVETAEDSDGVHDKSSIANAEGNGSERSRGGGRVEESSSHGKCPENVKTSEERDGVHYDNGSETFEGSERSNVVQQNSSIVTTHCNDEDNAEGSKQRNGKKNNSSIIRGCSDVENVESFHEMLNTLLEPYPAVFITYIKKTLGLFLNLLTPLFWEKTFSGFKVDESEIVKFLGQWFTHGAELFDKAKNDIVDCLTRSKIQVTNHDLKTTISSADSHYFRKMFLDHPRTEGTPDKGLRRYVTEQVVVKCVTHDPKVISRFSKTRLVPPRLPMTFIISHPHGNFKHISFGNLTRELSGPDNSYFEFRLKKYSRYKLSDEATEPFPNVLFHPPNVARKGSAMVRGQEYLLAHDIRLAVTSKVYGDNFDKFSTTKGVITWFEFPHGTIYILDDEYRSFDLPPNIQFDVTRENLLESRKYTIPSCSTHDIPACPGSSGALVNISTEVQCLYTHCGSHLKYGVKGYTCLSAYIDMLDESNVTLKDILGVRPILLVGGHYMSIYPGPKAEQPINVPDP